MPNENPHEQQIEEPADGPQPGGTSQDEPSDDDQTSDRQTRVHHPVPEPVDDTNEVADDRATIVEPDGSPSPRG